MQLESLRPSAGNAAAINGKTRRFYKPQHALTDVAAGGGEISRGAQLSQLSMQHAQQVSPNILPLSDLTREVSPETAKVEVVYSRWAADLLADVASWSYSDCETLIDALHQRGLLGPDATCNQVSVSNAPMLVISTAFFIRSGNVGVLSFRGTDPVDAINFLTDANVEVTNLLSLGHVHGGFLRNLRAVWFDIVEHVQAAIDDPDEATRLKALYITGHSLGAAMAVLAAAVVFGDSAFAGWRRLIQGIYTYGQPMVGDKEFARVCEERFGKLVFRHVYDHDLVPHLPPRSTGRFKHFGQEYIGGRDGWSSRATAVTQASTVFFSVPTSLLAFAFRQLPLLSRVRLPYSINDHSPNAYLHAFRAARD